MQNKHFLKVVMKNLWLLSCLVMVGCTATNSISKTSSVGATSSEKSALALVAEKQSFTSNGTTITSAQANSVRSFAINTEITYKKTTYPVSDDNKVIIDGLEYAVQWSDFSSVSLIRTISSQVKHFEQENRYDEYVMNRSFDLQNEDNPAFVGNSSLLQMGNFSGHLEYSVTQNRHISFDFSNGSIRYPGTTTLNTKMIVNWPFILTINSMVFIGVLSGEKFYSQGSGLPELQSNLYSSDMLRQIGKIVIPVSGRIKVYVYNEDGTIEEIGVKI